MILFLQAIFLMVISIFFLRMPFWAVNEIETILDKEYLRQRPMPPLAGNYKQAKISKVEVIPKRSFLDSNAYGIDHDLAVERKTTPFSDYLLGSPIFTREGRIFERHHLLLKNSYFGKHKGNQVILSSFKNLSSGIERIIKGGKKVENIQSIISQTIFYIMGSFIIGNDVKDCGSADEFYTLYMAMLKHLCNRNYSDEILRMRKFDLAHQPYKKRAIDDRKKLFAFINRIVVHRQDSLRSMSDWERDAQVDVLSRLIVKSESSGGIRRDEITEDLFGILFAGHDTATASIKYLLFQLCKDKGLQDRIRKEIIIHLGDLDGLETVNIKELASAMPLLTATIYETWRTTPPSPGTLIRKVTDEDGINHLGTAMPRDSVIMQSFATSQRNYDAWGKDADQFNPDRFLIKGVNGPTISMNKVERLLTFGFGRHGRLGNLCSSQMVIISMLIILNDFQFDLPNSADSHADMEVSLA